MILDYLSEPSVITKSFKDGRRSRRVRTEETALGKSLLISAALKIQGGKEPMQLAFAKDKENQEKARK